MEEGDTWYVFKLKSRERADRRSSTRGARSVRDRLVAQKQGDLYQKWVDSLRKKAKIVENEQVLSYDQVTTHEAFSPDD